MTGNLDTKQLGKYERHYVKKNGSIDALESLLGGISSHNNKQEIESIARSMYKEFHADKDRTNIIIMSVFVTAVIIASCSAILATRYNILRENVQQPLEIGLIVLALVSTLILCHQYCIYSTTEQKLRSERIFDQQDNDGICTNEGGKDSKKSNDIVTLMTRLKNLTDCVNPKGVTTGLNQ